MSFVGRTDGTNDVYYRIHGPEFLIEYGHADANPDHIHSVWRKFDDDFGRRTWAISATMCPRAGAAGSAPIVGSTPARRSLKTSIVYDDAWTTSSKEPTTACWRSSE